MRRRRTGEGRPADPPLAEEAANDPVDEFRARTVRLHHHEVVYRMVGSGPPVVLIHGLVNSSRHWRGVARLLAAGHTVIVPDLLGHGDSSGKPRGDYSLSAHATAIRDLLTVLGVDRATIVGHSLGGGIAMQFFYQFPERCERFGLISSGGLGPDVSIALRVAALPGTGALLALVARKRTLALADRAGGALMRRRIPLGVALRAFARSLRPLERHDSRKAFLETLRAVVDVHGQRVSARNRLYLAAGLPTLIIWGDRDRTIPIAHGVAAHEALAQSRMVVLPRLGHFPHLQDPAALAAAIEEWMRATEPARLHRRDWAQLLASDSRVAAAA